MSVAVAQTYTSVTHNTVQVRCSGSIRQRVEFRNPFRQRNQRELLAEFVQNALKYDAPRGARRADKVDD